MKSIAIPATIITLALFISTGLGNNDDEMDLGNLLQMGKYIQYFTVYVKWLQQIWFIKGMQFGKQFLGEEGMDKIKQGDFSQVMDLGKQFLGEETVNDILHAAADTIVQMKEKEKTEDDAPKDKVVDEL